MPKRKTYSNKKRGSSHKRSKFSRRFRTTKYRKTSYRKRGGLVRRRLGRFVRRKLKQYRRRRFDRRVIKALTPYQHHSHFHSFAYAKSLYAATARWGRADVSEVQCLGGGLLRNLFGANGWNFPADLSFMISGWYHGRIVYQNLSNNGQSVVLYQSRNKNSTYATGNTADFQSVYNAADEGYSTLEGNAVFADNLYVGPYLPPSTGEYWKLRRTKRFFVPSGGKKMFHYKRRIHFPYKYLIGIEENPVTIKWVTESFMFKTIGEVLWNHTSLAPTNGFSNHCISLYETVVADNTSIPAADHAGTPALVTKQNISQCYIISQPTTGTSVNEATKVVGKQTMQTTGNANYYPSGVY